MLRHLIAGCNGRIYTTKMARHHSQGFLGVLCHIYHLTWVCLPSDFPGGSDGKASAYSAGDLGSSPGLGRSPGEGNGNPLQYSCLDNPIDGGAWWATVHGVTKSQARLSDFTFTFMSIESVMPCSHLTLCRPLPALSLSQHQGLFQ